jgi:hypothetical protein
MKKHYKTILLVLASEDVPIESVFQKAQKDAWPLYPFMKSVYEAYMFQHPDIKVLFVYGAGTTFAKQDYDLIYEDIPEKYYPGMLAKTMRAFEHIDSTYSYDYLIRTNLSTFWDFDRLVEHLNTLPPSCISGTRILIKDKSLDYVAGFDLLISSDIVKKILPFSNEILQSKVYLNLEDIALNAAIKKYAEVSMDSHFVPNTSSFISMIPSSQEAKNGMLTEFSEQKYLSIRDHQIANNLNHFRIKTYTNRSIDKQVLSRLLLDIYEKAL